MEKADLILTEDKVRIMLVDTLMEYVRDNGKEMSEYFYNELGMDEEDEEGVKIVKVLDVSNPGCYFACQDKVSDERLEDLFSIDRMFMVKRLSDGFHHYSIWSLYIVREADGTERLKYYMFHSDGIEYEDDSEPDHDYVSSLTIADLHYVYEAVIKM